MNYCLDDTNAWHIKLDEQNREAIMMENNVSTLVRLSDTAETIAIGDADVRGRSVKDNSGEDLGKIDDLLIDTDENQVRFLQVASGGFLGMGKAKSLIPVDIITSIDTGDVCINQSLERIAGAPKYDPDLVDMLPLYENLYGYYGYPPYWGTGYVYPGFPYYP